LEEVIEKVEKSKPREIPENVKEIARLIDERAKLGAECEADAAKRAALVAEIMQIDAAVNERKTRLEEINKSLRTLTGL